MSARTVPGDENHVDDHTARQRRGSRGDHRPERAGRPDTSAYLQALDTTGVQYPSASKALELGTAVCKDLRQGATLASEGQDLVTSSQGAIGASAAALCSDQHDRIQAEVAAYKH